MGFYRKKPMIVEAWQWRIDAGREPKPLWVTDGIHAWPNAGGIYIETYHRNGPQISVVSPDGVATGTTGDWVLRGAEGEIYLCTRDNFAVGYEPVTVIDAETTRVESRGNNDNEQRGTVSN